MKKILLLSDTHGKFDDFIGAQIELCDEVWHAGDLGGTLLDRHFLAFGKTFRAVWGNIDSSETRLSYSEILHFTVEGLKVCMTHIGGYPGHYAPGIKALLASSKPGLFICGHSHILRVMPDKQYGLLFINPGAAGIEGFHKIRTMVRFKVTDAKLSDLEVIEKERAAAKRKTL